MATGGVAVAGGVGPEVGVSVGDRVTLDIRAVASGGAGVADLPDGRVAFIHRTVPGDRVEARVSHLRPRWGRATLERVLEEGSGRVEAPCPYYQQCGGCTLQHVAYDQQLAWKARFVQEALGRIGHIDVPLPEVVPSPLTTGYRNRVTFTVRKLAAGRLVAGFHGLEDPDHIVDVGPECLLAEPAILEAWGALRAAWRAGFRPLPGGKELRVTIRALAEGGVTLLVKGGAPGWDPSDLVARVPGLVGVWHHPGGGAAALRVAGTDAEERVGGDPVPLGGHAFLQVNRAAAAALFGHVVEQLPEAGGKAVDAYAGVAVYGRALARRGWKVTAIEVDPEACRGARHQAPEGLSVVEGRVEDHLPHVLPAEVVILNPPRTGLQEWVPGILAHHAPRTVIYVSCDPATLARDAERLGGVYRVSSLRSFDLFPQTSHVETVAVFTLGRPSGRER